MWRQNFQTSQPHLVLTGWIREYIIRVVVISIENPVSGTQ